ncbi:MAG: hypothetical protein WCD18_01205 [Thermosynechococcaceae cyanobacterium]
MKDERTHHPIDDTPCLSDTLIQSNGGAEPPIGPWLGSRYWAIAPHTADISILRSDIGVTFV